MELPVCDRQYCCDGSFGGGKLHPVQLEDQGLYCNLADEHGRGKSFVDANRAESGIDDFHFLDLVFGEREPDISDEVHVHRYSLRSSCRFWTMATYIDGLMRKSRTKC